MLKFLKSLAFWTTKRMPAPPIPRPANFTSCHTTQPVKAKEQPLAAPSESGRVITVQNNRAERDAMIRQLKLHEGERLFPYRCTAGKLTIGIGRNLDDRGITAQESAMLLSNDIDYVHDRLEKELPWMEQLDPIRQRVLLDMAFNLGIAGLLTFQRTLAAVRGGAYDRAAAYMLQSRWATQVGGRATRLSRMMATGQLPRELQ